MASTEAQVVIFTVPTTCSRPSIEMVGLIYLCIYLFLRVHSPDRIRLRGRTWPQSVKITVDEHLGYRNFE